MSEQNCKTSIYFHSLYINNYAQIGIEVRQKYFSQEMAVKNNRNMGATLGAAILIVCGAVVMKSKIILQ